jgi:hypothetical protein
MKANWGVEVQLHTFLTPALDGGEWSAHPLAAFSQEKSPQYPLDRRQGGPQSWCGCGGEEKNPFLNWELNPAHPAHSLVIALTELPQLHLTYIM